MPPKPIISNNSPLVALLGLEPPFFITRTLHRSVDSRRSQSGVSWDRQNAPPAGTPRCLMD